MSEVHVEVTQREAAQVLESTGATSDEVSPLMQLPIELVRNIVGDGLEVARIVVRHTDSDVTDSVNMHGRSRGLALEWDDSDIEELPFLIRYPN